jgi:hypothetical protein
VRQDNDSRIEEAIVKREKKWCREKKITCATFINLTKQPLQIQKLAEVWIMLANFSIMNANQTALLEKKRAIILQCDASS